MNLVEKIALTIGICSLSVCLPGSLQAEDWTAFRGPERDGIVRGQTAPLEWSANENIAWRTELPGQGWSSPVTSEESIYLTAAIENDAADSSSAYDLCLLIVNSETGELVRTTKIFIQSPDAPNIHKKNSHASPTPIIDGNNVYVHFGHLGTACLNLHGDIVWQTQKHSYSPVHGNGGSPTVVDDLLIFSRDGAKTAAVTALDKRTGKLVWETTREVEATKQFSFCTPLVAKLAGKLQLIIPGSNVVQSLDPATGTEYWRLSYDGYSVIPRPIVDSGLVFIATGYNTPKLLAIDPSGSGDVTDTHLKWQVKTLIPHTPSLLALGGSVAMVSDKGIASCLDAKTGNQLWKQRIGGNFSASPLLVGRFMYLLSEAGDCSIMDLAADQPTVAYKNSIGEKTLASFAVLDNTILLRSDKAIYRIGQ